jgi:hypothetical protein
MESWLMGYFGQWDQIEPDLPVPNYSILPCPFACCHSVNILSVLVWPTVISLSRVQVPKKLKKC